MDTPNSDPTGDSIVDQVEDLSHEVKDLAVNLAVYLAKAKSKSREIDRLEPEFVKLVNSAVKVVQELAAIISAARNRETMVYDVPSGRIKKDHIEVKLDSIVKQCSAIMRSLGTGSNTGG